MHIDGLKDADIDIQIETDGDGCRWRETDGWNTIGETDKNRKW